MSSLLAVHVSTITIPEDRQRTSPLDKERILELGESFKAGNQIHPIVLRREDETWILVAGFRRLTARRILVPNTAMRCGGLTLDPGFIAATDWGDLSEIEREEIELQENTVRVDLTLPEKAAALAKLDALRQAQAKAKGTIYTAYELTEEAKVAPDQPNLPLRIRETNVLLELSKHLDDPQAQKITTVSEAKSFLKKKHQATENAALRQAYEKTSAAGTANRLLLGSSYDEAILAKLPMGQFDVACFDPPYGIGADSFGEQGGVTPGTAGHLYKDDESAWAEVCARVPGILGRALKADAHIYAFCDPRKYQDLATALTLEGFIVWHVPLIWSKGRGILPDYRRGPRRTYEMILFAYRGERWMEVQGASDVLSHAAVSAPRHGAEKPVPLLIDLLMRSVRPGSLVLDLFAGSGSIFPAATATHSIAWGIEREQAHYDLALTRLTERFEAGAAAPREARETPQPAEQTPFSLEDLS